MRRLPALLVTVAVLLGATAVAQASTIYFHGADGGRTVRPRTVPLSADGTLDLVKVTWRQWGGATAIGSGTADYHGCDPDCAAGKAHSEPVTVVLSDRETCSGRVYYNRVALRDRHGRPLFASDLRLDTWAPCKER